jgi:hypothetical protein
MYYDQESDKERLEKIYQTSPSESMAQQFRRFWAELGRMIIKEFRTSQQKQPRIRKYFNVDGAPIWYAYDPVRKISFTSTSEYGVLTWLDEQR